jgi:RsmE family RNA methyltransferase
MARRRFFVQRVRAGHAELEGEAADHLRRVLRAERGQRFEISDNDSVYLAEIEAFGKGQVQFRVLDMKSPPDLAARFAAGFLIKFDRFEWIVERQTD